MNYDHVIAISKDPGAYPLPEVVDAKDELERTLLALGQERSWFSRAIASRYNRIEEYLETVTVGGDHG